MTVLIANSDSNFDASSGAFSLTIASFSVTSNANKRLLLSLTVDGNTIAAPGTVSFSANSQMFTFLGKYEEAATGRPVYVYELLQPTDGTYDIVGAFTGSLNHPSVCAVLLHDATQLPLTVNAGGGSGTSLSVTGVSTLTSNLLVAFSAWNNEQAGGITQPAGQTLITETAPGAFGVLGFVSSKVAASSSESMSWTAGSNTNGAVVLSIADAAADSISPVDPITDGEADVDLNPVGFAAGDIDEWSVDGIATTGTATTINNLDITALADDTGAAAPNLGPVTVLVSNGAESANAVVDNDPKAGYGAVVLDVIDTVTANSLYNILLSQESLTIATGDTFYYPDADGSSIDDDSNFEFFTTPKEFFYRDDTASLWYSITLSNNTGDPTLTLPFPLGSTSGVAAAESNVPVSVCTASDMVQVYSGVVSWGSDGVVPSITDAVFVPGIDYSIAIEGSFMAKFTVTAV